MNGQFTEVSSGEIMQVIVVVALRGKGLRVCAVGASCGTLWARGNKDLTYTD